jgi:hypothetical protein
MAVIRLIIHVKLTCQLDTHVRNMLTKNQFNPILINFTKQWKIRMSSYVILYRNSLAGWVRRCTRVEGRLEIWIWHGGVDTLIGQSLGAIQRAAGYSRVVNRKLLGVETCRPVLGRNCRVRLHVSRQERILFNKNKKCEKSVSIF